MSLVPRLILKDWYFNRWIIVAYIALGLVALLLIGLESEGLFYAGSILLITVLIGLGIHLAMTTVLQERKGKVLTFVMSLPISAMVYTAAKVLANLLIFLVPWITLVIGSFLVVHARGTLPDGIIPFVVVVLTEIFAAYCIVLGTALVTEAESWTIAVIVLSNLFFNFFIYYVSNMPAIAADMKGAVAVWGPSIWQLLFAEIAVAGLALALTFFFQSRKVNFV